MRVWNAPAPDDAVPKFVRERSEDHALETLREIERYARTDSPSADVPQYVVETVSLRDEATRRAVGSYAGRLVDYLERHEDANAETAMADVADDPADADGSGGVVIGLYFG